MKNLKEWLRGMQTRMSKLNTLRIRKMEQSNFSVDNDWGYARIDKILAYSSSRNVQLLLSRINLYLDI